MIKNLSIVQGQRRIRGNAHSKDDRKEKEVVIPEVESMKVEDDQNSRLTLEK